MTSVFKSPFWEAFGLVGGMIIGSGMFVLPYAVKISGFRASMAAAALAFFAVLLIHLAYGEIVVNTEERHRLPGYVKLYLGNFAGNLSKFSEIIFFNVTLLVYGALGGLFLTVIFGGSAFYWSLIFFCVSAAILFFGSIERIGFLNFILTIPLIGVILLISFLAFGEGEVGRVPMTGSDPFFAFGIFVFALTGLSVIPDAREVFKNDKDLRTLKPAIVFGTAVPLALYLVFILAMLMALGVSVSEDAVSGLEGILGRKIVVLGALAGFLAVITSFLVLAYDLRKIYELDLQTSKAFSWTVSLLLPAALFTFDLKDFVELVSIVGGVFIAVDGLFVILMLRQMRKTVQIKQSFLRFGLPQQIFLVLIFILSIIYEIAYQVF